MRALEQRGARNTGVRAEVGVKEKVEVRGRSRLRCGGKRDRKILIIRKMRMTRMTTVPVTELNR